MEDTTIAEKNCNYIMQAIDQFIKDCEEKDMFYGRYIIKAVLLNRREDEERWLKTIQEKSN